MAPVVANWLDYDNSQHSYSAKNQDGDELSLSYDEDEDKMAFFGS